MALATPSSLSVPRWPRWPGAALPRVSLAVLGMQGPAGAAPGLRPVAGAHKPGISQRPPLSASTPPWCPATLEAATSRPSFATAPWH